MTEIREISEAMFRLSCIGRTQFYYDPVGKVFGDGPIHYLVEVGDQLFMAWEDIDTKTMIVNPITRFDLDELEDLGDEDAWTVLHVPTGFTEGIQFRAIDNAELIAAYRRMEGSATMPSLRPVMPAY